MNHNNQIINPGQVLHNGAVAIAFKGSSVLAVNEGSAEPYVIWDVVINDGKVELYSGNYFEDIGAAVISFNTDV